MIVKRLRAALLSLSLAAAGAHLSAADTSGVRADLQGLYDEISQATLQFQTDSDIDQFHAVLYTPDWVFVDAGGHQHPWSEVRAETLRTLNAPRIASMTQIVRKVSLTPAGATAIVDVTTERTGAAEEGRYGPKGAARDVTEAAAFKDEWVKAGSGWKLKARTELAKPRVKMARAHAGN